MGRVKSKCLMALVASLLIVLMVVPANTLAQQEIQPVVQLTVEKATEMALNYTHELAELDQTIETLWDQHTDLMDMSNAMQQQLDSIDNYKRLYEKRGKGQAIDQMEQMELIMYRAMFGERPPQYSGEEMFNNYIKNRDFPHYSLWATIQNTKNTKEVVKMTLTNGVRQLYDQLLGLYDALKLQQDLCNNMEKQHNQLLAKYDLGQASELEKYLSSVALQQQKLGVEKFKRTVDNLEMMFKQQIGLPLNQKISLAPYKREATLKKTLTYQEYLNKALANRSEVVNARMDLNVKQREFDILSKYITDERLTDYMEAQQGVDDKTIALTEAINNTTSDIYAGYADVTAKRTDALIAEKKKTNADQQYFEACNKYDLGLIPLSALWNVEISLTQAKTDYAKAVRDYNNALYKLELAVGVGPGYNSVMGGQ